MNLEQIKKMEDAKRSKVEVEAHLKVKHDNILKELNEIIERRFKSEVTRLKAAANVHFKIYFEEAEFEVENLNDSLVATYGEYTVKFRWNNLQFIIDNNGKLVDGNITESDDTVFQHPEFLSINAHKDVEIERLRFNIERDTKYIEHLNAVVTEYCYELDGEQYSSFKELLKAIK